MAELAKDALQEWIDDPELITWARARADEILAHLASDDPLGSMIRTIRGDDPWHGDDAKASNDTEFESNGDADSPRTSE